MQAGGVWTSPATAMFKQPSVHCFSDDSRKFTLLRPRTGALRDAVPLGHRSKSEINFSHLGMSAGVAVTSNLLVSGK